MASVKEEPPEEEGTFWTRGGVEPEIKFIDSSRGRKVLVHEGHIFHTNSTVKGTTYFKCAQKYKGCSASIIVKRFNKKTGSYASYTVSNGLHVNHLPNPEKIQKREEKSRVNWGKVQTDFNSEAFQNSKHVCLFCVKDLAPGYLKVSALENVLPLGQVLSIPLDNPGKNSQAFDLLCYLMNVKWKRCREGQNFDSRKCLPLCNKCQNLYQDLLHVYQQIRELELHLTQRVKLIRELVCKTGGEVLDLQKTQLALLGLHVFRKKVMNQGFNQYNEDPITSAPTVDALNGVKVTGFFPTENAKREGNINSNLSTTLPQEHMTANVPLVKQEAEEVTQLNDFLDDNATNWLNGEESKVNYPSGEGHSFVNPGGEDHFQSKSASESEEVTRRSSTRIMWRQNLADHKKYEEIHPPLVEAGKIDNNGGSEENYSVADSSLEEDDTNDDDEFETKSCLKKPRKRKGKSSSAVTYSSHSTCSDSPTTRYRKKPRIKRSTAVNTCHICSATFIGQRDFLRHYKIKHPDEKRYTCTFCKKHFVSCTKAIIHQRNKHTGEKPFQCAKCSSAFASETLLNIHISYRHTSTIHPCPKCDKEFPSKTILTNHLTAIHGEAHKEEIYKKSKRPVKTLECHLCGMKVKGAGPFLQHYKELHPEEKRFTCKFCSRHFPYIREVLSHQRRHTGERPYKCQECDKSFTSDRALHSHVSVVHTNRERIFACNLCPKRYVHKTLLSTHLLSHQASVVICKSCGKTFRQQGTFYKHNRLLHEGKAECTKPITNPTKETLESLGVSMNLQCKRKCHVCWAPIPGRVFLKKHFQECHPNHPGDISTCRCGEKFSTYKKVYCHAIRKHPDAERAYQCNQCTLRFITASEMRNHSRTHVPVEERQKLNICEICGLGLATPYALVNHLKRHEGNRTRHVCELCGKSYAETKGLQQHKKTEHLKILPHQCPYCAKSFPLQSILLKHENIHTGEKSYRCSICNKNFHYSGSLSRHLREVHNARGEIGQTPRKKKNKNSLG